MSPICSCRVLSLLLAGCIALAVSPLQASARTTRTTRDREIERSNRTFTTSYTVRRDGSVHRSRLVTQMEEAAKKSTTDTAVVRIRNARSITPQTLRDVNSAAQRYGKKALLYIDSMQPSGDNYQVRMIVEPAAMAGATSNVLLGVYSDNEWTHEYKADYLDMYQNYLEVIHFDEWQSLPARVRLMVDIDLSKLDTSNLHLYSYNRSNNTTALIDTGYSFTASGLLVFYTELAGDILITDRALEMK